MRGKLAAVILVLLPVLTVMVSGCGTAVITAAFPDTNLEHAVRSVLNQPEGAISQEKLDSFTRLDLSSWHIQDLTGLEQFSNLTELNLEFNDVTDISPLVSLKKLEILNLAENPVSDLSPLSACTAIKTLDLFGCGIKSLHGLEDMVNLTELTLTGNRFSDVSPLSGLISLHYLDIHSEKDLISLANYLGGPGKTFDLGEYYCEIEDISPLSNLHDLRELHLDICGISDISPLSGLNNLTILSLNYNRIEDISSLIYLKNLQELGLENNPITNLEAWTRPVPENGQNLRINLAECPLDEPSVSTYIPLMEEAGIQVSFSENAAD